MVRLRLAVFVLVLLAFVLIPFAFFEGQFQKTAGQVLSTQHSAAYVTGAVILLLLADIVLPVPSSVVCTAAGALLGFPLGFAANFAGMTLGSLSGYMLGRYCRPIVIRKLIPRAEMERLSTAYESSAAWLVALSRPVPVLAESVTLIGGVVQTPVASFLLISAFANLAVAACYAYAGALARSSDSLLLAVFAALMIPGIARWLYSKLRTVGATGDAKGSMR